MKNEVLYIDGQLVDISDKGLGITLNFETNILDGLSKRKKNYTNTVKLPKTERNASVLGCAQMVSVVNDIPYQKHTARYILNGIEIFNDGECYLLRVSNDYEVTITFGRDPIRRIIEDNALLSDLTGSETWDVRSVVDGAWIETPTDSLPDIANIWHDSIEDVSLLKPYSTVSLQPYNPSVSVTKILDRIATQYGFTFHTTAVVDNILKDLYCLIAGKKGTDETFENESMIADFGYNAAAPLGVFPLRNTPVWDHVFEVQEDEIRKVKPLKKWKINVTGLVQFGTNIEMTNEQIGQVEFYLCDESGNPIAQLSENEIVSQGNKWYTAGINSNVEVKGGESFCFLISLPAGVSIDPAPVPSAFNGGQFGATITIPFAPEEVPFSTTTKTRTAPVFQNLPEVKIVDFLSTLNMMCNTYIYCVKDASNQWNVYFAPIEQDGLKDWTKRICQSSMDMVATNISYTPNGWARHNYLEWSNEYKGDIPVENEQLSSDERTWMKSVFNIPEGEGYEIPYYKYNDDNEVEFQKPKPYLFYVERFTRNPSASARMLLATRAHLPFDYIVEHYYSMFASWLKHPKVVTVQIMLTETDLQQLESIGRIYLAQFGAYFAPLTIQYKSGSPSKVQLLKIS